MMSIVNSFMLAIFLNGMSSSLAVGQNIRDATTVAKISLEDAKRYAIQHNYRVQSYVEDLSASNASVHRSRSQFYPSFGIAVGADHESTGVNNETASIGYVYGNINIFNGFKDLYSQDRSKLNSEITAINLKRQKFNIELEVEEQFHRYLYFQDLITIKNRALANNKKHQKLVLQTKSMGQVSQTDVMEFDIKDSVIQSELVSLRVGLEKSRIQLRRLLGEEVGNKIEPVGNLQHQHIEGDLMSYLTKIKNHSITVQLASKQHEVKSLEAKVWRSNWLPKIDFQARAGYLPLDQRPISQEVDGQESVVTFQLIATLDLFSGMDSFWQRKEGSHRKKSASLMLKEEILQSISEMEESYRDLKAIERRVDLELGNEAKCQKYYDSLLKEYKRGYKNSADLSAAADRLFATVARQTEFKFKFLQKRLNFERALGTSIQVKVIDKYNKSRGHGE